MPSVNGGPAVSSNNNFTALLQGRPALVTANLIFSNESDGHIYDLTSGVTLSIPKGLNWTKGVVVELPVTGATVTVQGDGNAVLLNGAITSQTRILSTTQRVISIYPRNAPDSYEVSGS